MFKHTQKFVGFCRRIVWVFDNFVGMALKGLRDINSIGTNLKITDDIMMQRSRDFGKTP